MGDDWHGLYGEGWKNEIVGEAFQHPAKYARGLIRRIYEHAVEEGWLVEGDTAIDPFAGVALGGLDAMFYGLNWVGVELEPRFVLLGQGGECDGIVDIERELVHVEAESGYKGWFVRLRPEAKYWGKNGLSHAEPSGDGFDAEADTLAYREMAQAESDREWPLEFYKVRHYEKELIPAHDEWQDVVVRPALCGKKEPHGTHHVEGNIELWNRRYGNGMLPRWGTAVIIQGDSRQLCEVLGGARAKGIVASPPYIESIQTTLRGSGIDYSKIKNGGKGRTIGREAIVLGYGTTDPANLGNMREGDHEAEVKAVISSPPWLDERAKGTRDHSQFEIGCRNVNEYGQSPGQLAAMPEGEFEAQAVVSSPPYMDYKLGSTPVENPNAEKYAIREGQPGNDGLKSYGDSFGQLCNTTGDTFWSAARIIVSQCYQVLTPGGVAIWVVKDFVRNKQIVPFTEQWRELCESCGFVTLHKHRCWLVEDRGGQYSLSGELIEKRVERKSFFRRLYEKKYPENSIDYEVVWCMRKL